MLGIKQEVLADDLHWSQQKISLLEGKETIEPQILDEVAKALKVPVEAIKNFDDEAAITYFNTFTHNSINSVWATNNNCTFNPLDKVVELYERLIKEKEAMIEELKKNK